MQEKTLAKFLGSKATQIDQEHRKVIGSLQAGIKHAAQTGRLLLEAKAKVAHGDFLSWVAEKTSVSARTAQQYMRLARHQNEIKAASRTKGVLTLTDALQLIAKPDECEAPPQLPPAHGEPFRIALSDYLASGKLTDAHVSVLAELEGFYTAGMFRDLSALRQSSTASNRERFSDPVQCVRLFRDIRPEDVPPFWILLDDDVQDGVIREACARFADLATYRSHILPQWVITAFWFASFAVYLRKMTPEQLAQLIDRWRQRILSAFACAWPGTDAQREACKVDPRMFDAYLSDLRHAGYPALQTDSRDDETRVTAMGLWEDNAKRLAMRHLGDESGNVSLPSSMIFMARSA